MALFALLLPSLFVLGAQPASAEPPKAGLTAAPTIRCTPTSALAPTPSALPMLPHALTGQPPGGPAAIRVWAPTGEALAAEGWFAQGPDGIAIRVSVPDAFACSKAWKLAAACEKVEVRLRLSSDGQDDSFVLPQGEQVDARDSVIQFGAQTPLAAATVLAGKAGSFALTPHLRRRVDPALKTVVYDLVLPWELLSSSPGEADTLAVGLLLQPALGRSGVTPPFRAHVAASAGYRPAALARFRLPRPAAPHASIRSELVALAAPGDPMHFRVRGLSPSARLSVQWQNKLEHSAQAACALPPGPFEVELEVAAPPVSPGRRAPKLPVLSLRVDDANGQCLASSVATPQPHFVSLEAARRRLQRLARNPHSQPPARRHARALKSALDDAVARSRWGTGLQRAPHMATLRALADAIASIPDGPARGAADPWEASLDRGERPSIEAGTSPLDGALNLGALFAPKRPTSSGEKRPLVVFLHGRIDPVQAAFVEYFVSPRGDGDEDAYVLTPWARGNLGAQELGESDVLALVDAVVQRYPIDVDAITLAGFSLGGSGAFSLAVHAPERFAGVAIASGGSWLVPLGRGLGANVASMPFYLWHGALDRVVLAGEQKKIARELREHGVAHEVHLNPIMGHTITAATRKEMMAFLKTKRRAPLQRFVYVSDGPLHRGRNGIALHYDAVREPFPKLEVQRTESGWRIEAAGSDGLEFAAGALDAEPSQQCEWIVDSTQHSGPCSPRSVGAGAARP